MPHKAKERAHIPPAPSSGSNAVSDPPSSRTSGPCARLPAGPAPVPAPAPSPASESGTCAAARQAFLYLQASVVGTLVSFVSRFAWSELVGFEAGVLLSTYTGMVIVFLLSYRRAFGVRRPDAAMCLRFVLVAHVGMAVVWVVSVVALRVAESLAPLAPGWPAGTTLHSPAAWRAVLPRGLGDMLAPVMGRTLEGGCHAAGIMVGFGVNFVGHRLYSFRLRTGCHVQGVRTAGTDTTGGPGAPATPPDKPPANPPGGPEPAGARTLRRKGITAAQVAAALAVAVPVFHVAAYAPYGMDTTDFGFFYGHAWRVLQGEVPYRDFFYVKPPLSLYWHAFWLWLTPERFSVLAGKAGFCVEMLAASWLGALYLARVVNLRRLGVPLPLLATLGFVWSVHSFPPMPWHTVEGVLFGAGALYAVAAGHPLLAGVLATASALTKQSYALMPLGVAVAALVAGRAGPRDGEGASLPAPATGPHWRDSGLALLGVSASFALFAGLLHAAGAWNGFLTMTTGQTGLGEALQAGIVLYVTQPLRLPALALLLWGAWAALDGRPRNGVQPLLLYVLLVAADYLCTVVATRAWIGYGPDWPLFLVTMGVACVLCRDDLVGRFAAGAPGGLAVSGPAPASARALSPADRAAVLLGAGLLLAWSTGISWGYKTPAFFAAPLWVAAMLTHERLGGRAATLAWVALLCGLVMFRAGYQYPYVFPQRPLSRADLVHDAGAVFPRLSGVKVDGVLLGVLRDLRDLRVRYGADYKTLPGFPLAYMLTGDRPAVPAEWLQDGEINGRVDEVYNLLVARDVVVFMERDQMDTVAPDNYPRTRYSVPARVRREWRMVDETEHFVVFRRP